MFFSGDIDSEGVVLSPSSVSQMLSSPGCSTVEEIFVPNEIVMNSPLDKLIREVSVSPTEELLEPNSTVETVLLSNPAMELNKQTNNLKKKKAITDINPSKKKKQMFNKDVFQLKSAPQSVPFLIKVEPKENDPPVISIPEMDFIDPEVLVNIFVIIIINNFILVL